MHAYIFSPDSFLRTGTKYKNKSVLEIVIFGWNHKLLLKKHIVAPGKMGHFTQIRLIEFLGTKQKYLVKYALLGTYHFKQKHSL